MGEGGVGQPPEHRHPARWESEGLRQQRRVFRWGRLVVRIMFSQVLIRVWREVLEFIIHPTGGGHGPGRLPAPEPASWLYWHVPFVMKAAEVHLRNPAVRQPSRRRAQRRRWASAGAASESAAPRAEGDRRQRARGASPSSCPSPLPPTLRSPETPSAPWRIGSGAGELLFQQQDRLGLLFFFFCFFINEGRRWDDDQVQLVLCQVQVCGEGKWAPFLLQPPRGAALSPLPLTGSSSPGTEGAAEKFHRWICFPGARWKTPCWKAAQGTARDVTATASAWYEWGEKKNLHLIPVALCQYLKKKIKIKRQLWRCVCFSRVWSLKGRNISCSLELAVRCDLLLQGSQVFSFILFL